MAFPGFRSWSPSRPDFFLSKADHARSADDSRARAREREEHWFLATLQLSPCCNMSVLNAMTVSFQSKKLIIFVFFLIKNKLLGRSVSADNVFWFVLFCFIISSIPYHIPKIFFTLQSHNYITRYLSSSMIFQDRNGKGHNIVRLIKTLTVYYQFIKHKHTNALSST